MRDILIPSLVVPMMLLAALPAAAQGMPAGERARGEARCPVGTVGEAVPGGFRCTRPGLAPTQGVPVGAPAGSPAGAAGGTAQEVSRGGLSAALPLGLGAVAIIGLGIAAASQGGSSPSGTR
jgi:hypothetical protein